MSEPGYLIGESLLGRIRGTVAKVEGAPVVSKVSRIQTRFEDQEDQPRSATVFRICTFTGAWNINASKTVTFKYQTTTPNTASALNLFANVPGGTCTTNCAIGREGTAWFLIAAECISTTT